MMLRSKLTNTELKKSATMNALAVMVFALFFLTSTLVHADHIATHAINAEQPECYICHQGIDTPTELPQVNSIFVASYCNNLFEAITAQSKVNYFIQPQLRAPPVI